MQLSIYCCIITSSVMCKRNELEQPNFTISPASISHIWCPPSHRTTSEYMSDEHTERDTDSVQEHGASMQVSSSSSWQILHSTNTPLFGLPPPWTTTTASSPQDTDVVSEAALEASSMADCTVDAVSSRPAITTKWSAIDSRLGRITYSVGRCSTRPRQGNVGNRRITREAWMEMLSKVKREGKPEDEEACRPGLDWVSEETAREKQEME